MRKTEKNKNGQSNRLGRVPVTFKPRRNKWELNIYHDGKRLRTLHETEEDALKVWNAHCQKLKRHGTHGEMLSKGEGLEFIEAKRIVPEVDLRDVARFYRHHHPEGASLMSVGGAAEEFLGRERLKGLSRRHADGLRRPVTLFAETHGDRQLRSITGNETLDWLNQLPHAPRTVANYRDSLANFFNWCRRREFVKESPLEKVAVIDLPEVKPKPKGVLTVDQAKAMMEYLDLHAPKYVPWHALQLFAGIRRAEVGRMDWDWIDIEAKTVTLPGWREEQTGSVVRVVKTGDDWVLHDLPENLWTWLGKHRSAGRIKVPGNDTVEKLHGEVFPEQLTPPIPKWPQNAMRHTFCTMMISLHGDAAKVANWSRHSSPKQLYKSYVAKLVSKVEAKRFCSIIPADRRRGL